MPDLETFAQLFAAEHRPDPYPLYRRWREAAPVAELAPGFLVVSGLTDATAVVRDPAFGHPDPEVVPPADRHSDDLYDDEGHPVVSFLGLNPPDHTRLRRLVSKAFTPRTVERLRPRVEAIAARLISEMREAGTADLMTALAAPLPVEVISELLGVPMADRSRFAKWSHALARALDPAFLVPDSVVSDAAVAGREFNVYFRALAADRRTHPGDDLLSDLVAVTDQGDKLTEAELLVTLTLLLVAGHETTTNLIGNGVLALLRHDALAPLADDSAAANAVEEILRYDSPVQLTTRVALSPTSVGPLPVAPGTQALVLIGAANRDPATHSSPDTFDPTREPTRHLAFGQGLHFCLGAPLARLEGRTALRELARHTPALSLSDPPTWNPTTTLRGLATLPVSVH